MFCHKYLVIIIIVVTKCSKYNCLGGPTISLFIAWTSRVLNHALRLPRPERRWVDIFLPHTTKTSKNWGVGWPSHLPVWFLSTTQCWGRRKTLMYTYMYICIYIYNYIYPREKISCVASQGLKIGDPPIQMESRAWAPWSWSKRSERPGTNQMVAFPRFERVWNISLTWIKAIKGDDFLY